MRFKSWHRNMSTSSFFPAVRWKPNRRCIRVPPLPCDYAATSPAASTAGAPPFPELDRLRRRRSTPSCPGSSARWSPSLAPSSLLEGSSLTSVRSAAHSAAASSAPPSPRSTTLSPAPAASDAAAQVLDVVGAARVLAAWPEAWIDFPVLALDEKVRPYGLPHSRIASSWNYRADFVGIAFSLKQRRGAGAVLQWRWTCSVRLPVICFSFRRQPSSPAGKAIYAGML
jgi:hypothetical protein